MSIAARRSTRSSRGRSGRTHRFHHSSWPLKISRATWADAIRVQLRVHEHHLLVVGDLTGPDGDQPTSRVRALVGRPGTSAQRQQRMQTDKSILDSLGDDVKELERGLGTRDLGRLHEYLDRVREVERRIQCQSRRKPIPYWQWMRPLEFPRRGRSTRSLWNDLAALAYQADITRVLTYMLAKDASMIWYTNLGVSEPHHSTTHHLDLAESVSNLVKINTYHMTLFARFLETLSTTPDGDGSLLDHSLILFGSGMSEANTHSRLDIPTLLVGGSAVGFKGNRHIQTAKETPFANCLLALANRFGCELQSFGTLSTGELAL